MAEEKESFKEVVDRVWPKTKKELDKALENTKKMLNKGEKYLKVLSERGVETTKKLSLSAKREKLCYDLGKTAAGIAPDKWAGSKKMALILKEIKSLDKQIKKIK